MSRIEKMPDLTDKKVDKIAQKSQRTKSFMEQQYDRQQKSPERLRAGNTSEAAQERTSSSRDRDIEPDAGIAFSRGRQKLRQRRWQENRRDGGIASESGDSQRYWQGSEAESGHDDGTSNTSELGELKGGWGEQLDNAIEWGVNKWTKGEKQWRVTYGKKSEHRPGMYKLQPDD